MSAQKRAAEDWSEEEGLGSLLNSVLNSFPNQLEGIKDPLSLEETVWANADWKGSCFESRKRSANGDLARARRENLQAGRPQLLCQLSLGDGEEDAVHQEELTLHQEELTLHQEELTLHQEELTLRREELELRREGVVQQRIIADSLSRLVDLMAAELSKN